MNPQVSRDQLARRSIVWIFLMLLSVTLLFLTSFFGQLKHNDAHNARVTQLISEHVISQSKEYVLRNDLLALGAYLQQSVSHYDELSAVVVSDAARQILAKSGNGKGESTVNESIAIRGAASGRVQLWLRPTKNYNFLGLFLGWLLCCFGLTSLLRYLQQLPAAPVLDAHQMIKDPIVDSRVDSESEEEVDEAGQGRPINVYIQAKNVKRLQNIVSPTVFDSVMQQYLHIMNSSAALYMAKFEQIADELWKISIPFMNNESQSVVKALSCASVFVESCCRIDECSDQIAGPSIDFHVLVNNISREAEHDEIDMPNKLLVNAALCDWEYVNERVHMLGDDIDWNGMDYIPCQLQSELQSVAENHAVQLVQHVIS